MAEIPNIAKGRFAQLASLPAANDALVWVLLQSTGLESAATLRDYDTLALILAAANDEPTSPGYARVPAAGVVVTVDDANDRVDVDCTTDPSWTFTSAVQNIGAVVLCYDPDTTGGTDADLVPLFIDVLGAAFVPTVNVAFTYQVAPGGWGRDA